MPNPLQTLQGSVGTPGQANPAFNQLGIGGQPDFSGNPILKKFSDALKGAPQQTPAPNMQDFFQPESTSSRQALLQAMMQRSRAGRAMPSQIPAMQT